MDCLLFVSRGKVVEKQGAYDDNVPEIVYQQGNIINLHLLNHQGNNKSKTTIFCHEESSARIVRIDHTELAKILNEESDELTLVCMLTRANLRMFLIAYGALFLN